jgi:O-antigen ligase
MAGDSSELAPGRAERIAFAMSALFLFAAPIAGSAGTRATTLIVAAIALAFSRRWREAMVKAPRMAIALITSWFLLAAMSLGWSIDPRETLAELRAEALYGALAFGVFFLLATDERRWRAWWLALIAGTLFSFAASKLQGLTGIALWRNPPDGGVGAYSTHLVLIAPFLVALAWPRPWGFGSKAWILVASLIVLLVAGWTTRESWTTPNRIVWPSFGVVFLAAILAGRKAAARPAETTTALKLIVAATGVVLAFAFIASIVAKNERFYPNDPDLAASVERDLRPRLWAIGWEKWKDAPWLGHGFGRDLLDASFLPETPRGVSHPPITHAHNAFLNIGLQLGIVGAILFGAVLAAFAREYAAALSQPAASALGVIGLALLAGFVTKNLTDDFLHRHNAQVFWALNGMLLGFSARARAN